MVTISDAQQQQILSIAAPLDRDERLLFMAALAELIAARRSSPGEGELMRVLRDLQGRYFQSRPTDLEVRPTRGKLTDSARSSIPADRHDSGTGPAHQPRLGSVSVARSLHRLFTR